jgi:hypothetical protein
MKQGEAFSRLAVSLRSGLNLNLIEKNRTRSPVQLGGAFDVFERVTLTLKFNAGGGADWAA